MIAAHIIIFVLGASYSAITIRIDGLIYELHLLILQVLAISTVSYDDALWWLHN